MKNGAPGISVIGIGKIGSSFGPAAFADAAHGLYDPERSGHERLKLRNGHGARDVTPTPAQEAAASTGKEPSAARSQVIEDLFVRAYKAIVLEHAQDGVCIVAHDEAGPVKRPLSSLHVQLPQQRIVSLLGFPGADHEVLHADDGCAMLDFGRAPSPLTAIGHFGPRSPFALTNGHLRQEEFVVATHNALANAPRSHPNNPSAGDVMERLGALGPCFQFSFSSQPLALAQPKRVWGSLRRLGGGGFTPGFGSLDDALKAAAIATVRAHGPEALATPEPFDASIPHFVLYLVPFQPGGPAFQEFAERQGVWLGTHYPAADGIYVSGNGVPLLDGEGERFLQVSVLAPMAGPARPGA